MQKTFHFVNGIGLNQRGKRESRRHVMMGKNAGKTIHRPSRLVKRDTSRCERVEAVMSIGAARDTKWDTPLDHATSSIRASSRVSASSFLNISFPVTLTRDYAEVISDSFYCNVALMQACNELFLRGGESSPIAMYYLSKSLAQVRERLESSDALSDATVCIVMSLVTQEQVRNQHAAARIHMDGLARMIELRGGLDSLEGSLPVLLKACKTDIMLALQYEETPRFVRNKMPQIRSLFQSKFKTVDFDSTLTSIQHNNIEPYLFEILGDIINVTSLFNDRQPSQEVDLFSFQEIFVSISYSLIEFDSMQDRKELSTTHASYHVGLTIFMMTFFLQYGRQRIMKFESITQRLRTVIERGLMDDKKDLMLWLMMMGGIWMLDDADVNWLAPKVRCLAQEMGLRSWDEVIIHIIKYPWIHDLHDEPGGIFWDRVHQLAERPVDLNL
ncbi:hypothetical protein BDV95DRAFT_602616 [Massariosphaeria phaeospora]|uniref:Fungal-specific transcription factor domain-containing protein n=1 Tax=Massariosphaeria phaeospora TaxID=100035 RepID=A0A7C8IFR5_9PLEO|nr:hypothetical protein BDV95DRAFT_602616 [Massariosphaeria phaeospora]